MPLTTVARIMMNYETQYKIFNIENSTLDTDEQIQTVKAKYGVLIEKTLKELIKISEPDLKYENFLSLFEAVNKEPLLSIHRYPKLDEALGISILATKQRLLGYIREESMKMIDAKIKKANCVHCYIKEILDVAEKSPIFTTNLSNIPSFLRFRLTPACRTFQDIRRGLEADSTQFYMSA